MNDEPKVNEREHLGDLLARKMDSEGELAALISMLTDEEVRQHLGVLETANVLIAAAERKVELLKRARTGLLQAVVKLADERRQNRR